MKKIISKLFRRNTKFQDVDREFSISKEIPKPIRNISLQEQMSVIDTLRKLPTGASFPIRNELNYTVRKMAEVYCPEYKLTIRNMGNSKRVFRIA